MTVRLALEAVERAQARGESLVIPDGPESMARSDVLDQAIERGWVSHGRPMRGDDRISVLPRPRLTESGEVALSEARNYDPLVSGHPFGELSVHQVRVIEIAWSSFVERRAWPIFQYVETVLFREGLDLSATLRSLPTIGASYRPVWYQSMGGGAQPESPVGVTIAGLIHLPEARETVNDFLVVIRDLARRIHSVPPDPKHVQQCRVRFADLASVILGRAASGESRRIENLQALLKVEPATWQGTPAGEGTEWTWEAARFTGRFHAVKDVDDYLGRLTEFLQAPLLPALTRSVEIREPVPTALAKSSVVLADLIDTELWSHVQALYEIGRWDTLARDACTFLEDFLRRIGDLEVQQLSGADLIKAVLHPEKGSHPLKPTGHVGEAEGWHLYALGIFKAVRNASGHRLNAGADERHAVGVLGAVSLLITQLRLAGT